MRRPLNNEYEVLILPVDYSKSFLEMTRQEIQQYYQWFSDIKENRLNYVCSFLFSNSQDCLREKNLDIIELFLMNTISTIRKSDEQIKAEVAKIPKALKVYATPDDYLFDKKTISACFDTGIFLGELIIKLDHKIEWKLETDDEYADYGQPVIWKKGYTLSINPLRVAKNIASKIYEGRYSDRQIVSFFNAWKKGFKVTKE